MVFLSLLPLLHVCVLFGFLLFVCSWFSISIKVVLLTMKHIPITQDAYASAHKIFSHFMMNHIMGRYTNLIHQPSDDTEPRVDGDVYDIYSSLLDELADDLLSPVALLPLGLHVALQAEHNHEASLLAIVPTMNWRPHPRPTTSSGRTSRERWGKGDVAADSTRD